MQRFIIVIYDKYELRKDGMAVKSVIWEKVPFAKENIVYEEEESYEENASNFVAGCIESKCVYIGEKYVPIYNIHGWYFDKKEVDKNVIQKPNQVNTNEVNRQDNRRYDKFKKIKHKQRHNQNQPKNQSSSILPFKVEGDFIPNQGIIDPPILPVVYGTPPQIDLSPSITPIGNKPEDK